MSTYVEKAFIAFNEEKAYTSGPVLFVGNGSELADPAPITHRLEYVVFRRPFHSLHVLRNFAYWWKKFQFK